MLKKIVNQIIGTFVLGTVGLGTMFTLFWATTTFIDHQVDKRVAGLEKKTDETSSELKELRLVNLHLAEIIARLAEKNVGGQR